MGVEAASDPAPAPPSAAPPEHSEHLPRRRLPPPTHTHHPAYKGEVLGTKEPAELNGEKQVYVEGWLTP